MWEEKSGLSEVSDERVLLCVVRMQGAGVRQLEGTPTGEGHGLMYTHT